MNAVQKAFHKGGDYENCYIFSPSVSRYFNGGKDFEQTMKSIAVQRTMKK